MPVKIRWLSAFLLAALLLAACSVPPDPLEHTDTPALVETQNLTSQAATPTLAPPPADTPTSPPPTTAPVDTQAPTETATSPVPPPGPTLERLSAGQEPVFTRLQMFDPLSGWATGGLAGVNDHLFITYDGGNTWSDVTPPQPGESSTLEVAAFFLDASTAWATFYGMNMDVLLPPWPVVWRTADAGQTWQVSQLLDMSGLDQAYSTVLYFADAQHGWLLTHVGVGMSHDYVTLFHTTDGGLTWERLLDPYNDGQIQACQKTGMFFLDSQVGWLTGDCGGVMAGAFLNRTEDGGTTWTYIDLPAPLDQPLLYDVNAWAACGSYDLRFFDPQTAVLGVRCTLYDPASSDPTFAHYMYATQDGGLTWSSQPYPGGTLMFVTPQNGWALSRDIYQTTDGGVTWDLVNNVHWDARFDFISPQLGWAASYTETEHALVATTDGGAHWFMLAPMVIP
jgi:photosystem II stability/assembly factor-like uncharacterized protein